MDRRRPSTTAGSDGFEQAQRHWFERACEDGGPRLNDGGIGLRRLRGEDRHDRRDLPEGALHGLKLAGEKGGPTFNAAV